MVRRCTPGTSIEAKPFAGSPVGLRLKLAKRALEGPPKWPAPGSMLSLRQLALGCPPGLPSPALGPTLWDYTVRRLNPHNF